MSFVRHLRPGLVAVAAWLAAVCPALADAEQDCRTVEAARAVVACATALAGSQLTPARRIEALNHLSRAQLELKSVDAASKAVDDIFKADPDSATGYFARARLREAQVRDDQAKTDYDQAVARAADKYEPLMARGNFHLRQGRNAEARADFEAAMRIQRNKAAPYIGRAKVHRALGNDLSALSDLDTAARLEPSLAEVYLERGELWLKRRDHARARADFERALALSPGNARATRGRQAANAGATERSAGELPRMAPPGSVAPPAPSKAPGTPAPSAAPAKAPPPPPMVASPAPRTGAAPSSPPPATSPAAPPTVTAKPPALPAAPARTLSTSPKADGAAKSATLWDVVPVFYGTDRKRGPDNKRVTYTADRAARLELGRADITVPKAHQVPNIERPFAIRVPFTSITLYEAAEDPSKHFTIREIKGLTRAQFLEEVRARLARASGYKDRAVVFIHGYNTDFDFALYRTAQMAYDLKFDGAPFLYSWPSGTGITSYISDRDNADQTEPYLREFLELVIRETGAKSVSLIAHSMGNLPLLRVLRDIEPKLPANVKLDQLILAAPDVDRGVFEQLASSLTKVGRGITLYASSQDRAMAAARMLRGGPPRAGDVPPEGPVVIPGIDTIDISTTTMESLTLGHSLYAERDALINDIALLIQTGERPPDKRIPILRRMSTPKGDYWKYP